MRNAPVIRAILLESKAAVAARVIAEEMNTGDDGLKKILQVKVNQIKEIEKHEETGARLGLGAAHNGEAERRQ